jgi:hypothetical protein
VGIIGINPDYDYLYDPQQAPTYGCCERCGQELFAKGAKFCSWCLDNMEPDEGWDGQWD